MFTGAGKDTFAPIYSSLPLQSKRSIAVLFGMKTGDITSDLASFEKQVSAEMKLAATLASTSTASPTTSSPTRSRLSLEGKKRSSLIGAPTASSNSSTKKLSSPSKIPMPNCSGSASTRSPPPITSSSGRISSIPKFLSSDNIAGRSSSSTTAVVIASAAEVIVSKSKLVERAAVVTPSSFNGRKTPDLEKEGRVLSLDETTTLSSPLSLHQQQESQLLEVEGVAATLHPSRPSSECESRDSLVIAGIVEPVEASASFTDENTAEFVDCGEDFSQSVADSPEKVSGMGDNRYSFDFGEVENEEVQLEPSDVDGDVKISDSEVVQAAAVTTNVVCNEDDVTKKMAEMDISSSTTTHTPRPSSVSDMVVPAITNAPATTNIQLEKIDRSATNMEGVKWNPELLQVVAIQGDAALAVEANDVSMAPVSAKDSDVISVDLQLQDVVDLISRYQASDFDAKQCGVMINAINLFLLDDKKVIFWIPLTRHYFFKTNYFLFLINYRVPFL